jgi:hypothetical protein
MPPPRQVSADTVVYTKKGDIPVEELANKTLPIWNGYEWTNATIRLVEKDAPVIIVEIILAYILDENEGKYYTDFQQLVCTPNCHFTIKSPHHRDRVICDYADDTRISALYLERGMSLKNWKTVCGQIIHESIVWGIYDIRETCDIYEVDTPDSDTVVLNGVLVS